MQRNLRTKLAKDVPDLDPFMCNALEVLQDTFAANGRVCLEGTQGTGLSLYHGSYPLRDVSRYNCLWLPGRSWHPSQQSQTSCDGVSYLPN